MQSATKTVNEREYKDAKAEESTGTANKKTSGLTAGLISFSPSPQTSPALGSARFEGESP